MDNESLKIPGLTDEWKKEIAEFENKYQNLYFEREDFRILYDAIKAVKHELYFASLSTMWTFIEKYLRDRLIESEMENINKESEKYGEEYTKKESEIENGKNLKGDDFYKICKKLKSKNLLDGKSEIEEIYKIIRIAVHHGIYGRLHSWTLGLQKNGKIGNLSIINDAPHRKEIIGNIMQSACYATLKKVIIPLLEDDKSLS